MKRIAIGITSLLIFSMSMTILILFCLPYLIVTDFKSDGVLYTLLFLAIALITNYGIYRTFWLKG